MSHEPTPIPAGAGIGLRAPHHARVLAERPAVPWFEVCAEDFFGEGGQAQQILCEVRSSYPISLHGVGLSLGSAAGLDEVHLAELGQLVNLIEPGLVSEHLCWGAIPGRHLNELLPLPYTEEALQLMIENVEAAQNALRRQILVENIASYLTYSHSTIPEWEFLAELARSSGCGILCDVNNIHVNSVNHGFNAEEYLAALPPDLVQEIHIAGFTEKQGLNAPLLIDSHNRAVAVPVWRLYAEAVKRFGRLPTLIEWDRDIPAFSVLMGEAQFATRIMVDDVDIA